MQASSNYFSSRDQSATWKRKHHHHYHHRYCQSDHHLFIICWPLEVVQSRASSECSVEWTSYTECRGIWRSSRCNPRPRGSDGSIPGSNWWVWRAAEPPLDHRIYGEQEHHTLTAIDGEKWTQLSLTWYWTCWGGQWRQTRWLSSTAASPATDPGCCSSVSPRLSRSSSCVICPATLRESLCVSPLANRWK